MQKFEFLQQPLLGEIAMSRKRERRKKEREKMPFIVATYVYASSQRQRMHSARTKSSIFQYKCTYFQKEILGVSFKDHTPVRLSSLKVLFHMLKYGNMSLLQPDKATGRRL